MYLSRRDFDRHGYTDGCRGCLDLASGKQRAGSFLSPHNVACRRRMEAMIKTDDPDRWARWLLRRGQEEEAEEAQEAPTGDAGAPSGSAEPEALSKVSEEVKVRQSRHHEEATERKPSEEALKEASERDSECQESSTCTGRPDRLNCVARPLTGRSENVGGDLVEMLCRVDLCEVFSPPRVGKEAVKFGLSAADAMDPIEEAPRSTWTGRSPW